MPSSQTSPGPTAAPNITSDCEGSLASYFDAFAPLPQWGELVWWPPDVFALANLVLDHTGAYRFVVAPPPGKRWPPLPDWGEQMRDAGRNWRASLPPLVSRYWAVVTEHRDTALTATRSRPRGRRGSRVVAHWNSPVDGAQEIQLAPRAAAILLSMSVETTTLWTADGRSHPDVPYLDLTEVQQLRATV